LEENSFPCLVAYPNRVEKLLEKGPGGNIYLIFYAPRKDQFMTLKAYRRKDFTGPHYILDYSPDTTCTLRGQPPGRYTLTNLHVDSSQLRTLHEQAPSGDYEYLLFIPKLVSDDQVTYTIYRREKHRSGDTTATEKIYIYDPVQANPTPPREPD
jgi:hypothetical protein